MYGTKKYNQSQSIKANLCLTLTFKMAFFNTKLTFISLRKSQQ
jgi:hypothetical protein